MTSDQGIRSESHDSGVPVGESTVRQSFCRACGNLCPVLVEVQDGQLLSARGDPANPLWAGYTCVKGRGQPSVLNSSDRLLHSLKRNGNGEFEPIGVDDALDEIAAKLSAIVDAHGPDAVAGYWGTGAGLNNLSLPMLSAFMRALGSNWLFDVSSIDKPGKKIAKAMHGTWMAPLQQYDRPEVAMLIGANPLQSYFGVACGHPTQWLSERLQSGMKLIVIDPRRSDIAARATIHLQARPGCDVAILASMIHVILAEGLYDREFVNENATGIDVLRHAVAAAKPAAVAALADVAADDIVRAARTFAEAGRGYACAGVGPSFSSSDTLVEYLVLNLETLCGHWLREGEAIPRTPSLLPSIAARAQAKPPVDWRMPGAPMRATGLPRTNAGLPTGAAADDMLMEGPDRIRALICCGGAPIGAWPDQLKSIEALKRLDLLIQVDPWMSQTAELADYVIAPKMSYEVPAVTLLHDYYCAGSLYYGPVAPHAQYTPAVVSPPPGSDVIEDWEAFYGLAQRMGLQLALAGFMTVTKEPTPFDMNTKPTSDELLEIIAGDGRVSLEEVKQHPSGISVPDPNAIVLPKEEGWQGRLELGHPEMMRDLAAELDQLDAPIPTSPAGQDSEFPFRLLCRRVQQSYNNFKKTSAMTKGRGYNPAFIHPDDLDALQLQPGDSVWIISGRGRIPAIVQPDANLRRTMVSMSHGFGAGPERDGEYAEIGSATSRLVDASVIADPYAHMPKMSNIPIRIEPLDPATAFAATQA